jgi:hypothetical protein
VCVKYGYFLNAALIYAISKVKEPLPKQNIWRIAAVISLRDEGSRIMSRKALTETGTVDRTDWSGSEALNLAQISASTQAILTEVCVFICILSPSRTASVV